MKTILCAILFYMVVLRQYASAVPVMCFVCDTSRTNEECTSKGGLVRCKDGEMCLNEVRRMGNGVHISKRCKQIQACDNNLSQGSVCDPSQLSSVCRSCCIKDRCNSRQLYIGEEPELPVVVRTPVRIPICSALEHPQNGRKVCEFRNKYNEIGTQCRFACSEGYELIGDVRSTCVRKSLGAKFDKRTPICKRKTCPTVPTAPTDGSVSCTRSKNTGSVCTFSCNAGFLLRGSRSVTCEQSKRWTTVSPTCHSLTCPLQPHVQNGRVECTNSNRAGSECSFSCNSGFELTGHSTLVCNIEDATAVWNNAAPICTERLCVELNTINNGQFSCSNSNHFNSTCSLECNADQGYFPSPSNTEFVCMDGMWNAPKPCCTRSCPPYTVMDLVVILDSSSSVGLDNWNTMKSFAKRFVGSFVIASNLARVSVIRYNRHVDIANRILFRDFPDNRTGLLSHIDQLPYEGSGTKTGLALRYAKDVLLQPISGNRENVKDVVLIITDGRSQDNVTEVSQQLRDMNVLINVIGIVPSNGRGLDAEELLSIAGTPDHLQIATSGFSDLNENLMTDLSDHFCRNPCGYGLTADAFVASEFD
ncbi:E-selectin-like [Ciona intestinalis]